MTEITSSFTNPETRLWGSFYDDMNTTMKQDWMTSYRHFNMLGNYEGSDPIRRKAARFANTLAAHQVSGAIVVAEKNNPTSEWHQMDYLYVTYNMEDAGVAVNGRMGFWYDADDRLFKVLEYNKVKGMVIRSYKPMTFLTKFERTYLLYAGQETPITAQDFQPYFDILFPDMSSLSVEVLDKPSVMYDSDNIGSCMTGEDYVKFYDTAPVKGLVVKMNGDIVTRALLWTLDDGRRFMGRVYDSCGRGRKLLEDWCNANDVLVNQDDSMRVTAPISPFGVPYQDNFTYGVRIKNDLVLFECSDAALVYKRRTNGLGVYGLCCTEGNERSLRQPLILCVDGTYATEEDVVIFEGQNYNMDTLTHVNVHNYYRLSGDTVVRNPYSYAPTLVRVSDLTLHNGNLVLTSAMINFEGQMVIPADLSQEVKLVDDKLVAGDLVLRRTAGGYNLGALLGSFQRTRLHGRLNLSEGLRNVALHCEDYEIACAIYRRV